MIYFKEMPNFLGNRSYLDLIRMNEQIENYFCSMNRVGDDNCYELKLKSLSNRTTLVLSNTRELNRVSSTKCLSYILLLMVCAHYHAPYPK